MAIQTLSKHTKKAPALRKKPKRLYYSSFIKTTTKISNPAKETSQRRRSANTEKQPQKLFWGKVASWEERERRSREKLSRYRDLCGSEPVCPGLNPNQWLAVWVLGQNEVVPVCQQTTPEGQLELNTRASKRTHCLHMCPQSPASNSSIFTQPVNSAWRGEEGGGVREREREKSSHRGNGLCVCTTPRATESSLPSQRASQSVAFAWRAVQSFKVCVVSEWVSELTTAGARSEWLDGYLWRWRCGFGFFGLWSFLLLLLGVFF